MRRSTTSITEAAKCGGRLDAARDGRITMHGNGERLNLNKEPGRSELEDRKTRIEEYVIGAAGAAGTIAGSRHDEPEHLFFLMARSNALHS